MQLLPFPLVTLSAFGAGRWAERTSAIAGGLALVAVSLAAAVVSGESWVPYVLASGVGWIVGQAVRERQLVTDKLAERARELAQEQDAYAELSVRYERARIAAELHDIVAHAISVMVVQASAGQRLAATSPQLTAETFDAISGRRTAGRGRHGPTRRTAGRRERDRRGARPRAGRGARRPRGRHRPRRDPTTGGHARRASATQVVQATTRIVREGLTNALRYATGAPVRVLLRGGRDAMIVEVANDRGARAPALAGHGTGNGLRGLREQLDALGGQLEAGPSDDGGWSIRARIPIRLAADAAYV